uniref:Putative secreted protein n=1 Tax=Anopheles triannulatus TaxID=58253 RepID=A0A2M4B675_9DIPT
MAISARVVAFALIMVACERQTNGSRARSCESGPVPTMALRAVICGSRAICHSVPSVPCAPKISITRPSLDFTANGVPGVNGWLTISASAKSLRHAATSGALRR